MIIYLYVIILFTSCINILTINIPSHRLIHLNFIYNRHLLPKSTGNINRLFLNSKISDQELNDEIQDLYKGLKDKKWSFNDLQLKLTNEGITLDGCNRPDDVIKRVAQLNILGKEKLMVYLQDNDPEFSSNYIKLLQENTNKYENLSDDDKKSFIESLKSTLTENGITTDDKHMNVLELYSRFQTDFQLKSKLPSTKPDNDGVQNVEAYKSEAESIMGVYNRVKSNNEMKEKLISDVCNELDSLSVDYKDCKTDEQLINRLAYARVYPKEERGKTTVKSRRRVIQNGPLRTVLNIQTHNLNDIFPNNGGSIFDSFFNDIQNDIGFDGTNLGNGFSILKDIASMFGLDSNLLGQQQQQIQFQNEEKFNDNIEDRHNDDVEDDFIETDPELLALQRKAQLSGDSALQNMINKAIKDPNLRNVLKIATTKGYQHARDACSGDRTSLYILDKLNDKHMWSS